jgi:hypothetical protein
MGRSPKNVLNSEAFSAHGAKENCLFYRKPPEPFRVHLLKRVYIMLPEGFAVALWTPSHVLSDEVDVY